MAIDIDLEDHPKLAALIARRRWSVDKGLAFLFRFWRTVRRHAIDGDITGWSDAYVGRMTNTSRSAGLLADLVLSGFIDECDARRTVHGWMERNGDFLRRNSTQDARAAGGRKGGATRAASGQRDTTGRYRRSVDHVWPESGPDSDSRVSEGLHSEQ
jgi:hypothetical protein